jgi:hypothetical protein
MNLGIEQKLTAKDAEGRKGFPSSFFVSLASFAVQLFARESQDAPE